MKDAAGIVVVCLALAACAPAAPNPNVIDGRTMSFPSAERPSFHPPDAVWSPVHASPANPIADTQRPSLLTSFDVVYSAVPLLERPAGSGELLGFELGGDAGYASYLVAKGHLVELERGRYRTYTFPTSAAPKGLRRAVLDVRADKLRCDEDDKRKDSPVVLRGFDMGSWKADRIEYREYEGSFIHAECIGTARAVQRVTAPALIPGVLYTFRRSVASLDGTKEELVVVGPSSIWVTSSNIAGEQLNPHVGTFTVASAPVRRGSTGAMSLQIHQDQLAHFVGLRTQPPKWADSATEEILEIKIDVVWPKEDDGPSVVVFVSQVTPLAVRLLDLSPRPSQ